MADERDPDVSRRYRELGAEEPPRALDEAILAASRKSLKRRSWYGPVALAATLVLVVAVSIQVERQKPDEEFVAQQAPQPAAAPAEKKEELPLKEERVLKARPARPPQAAASAPSSGFTPDPKPAAPELQSADQLRDLAKSTEPAARSDAAGDRPAAAPAPAPARQAMERPRAEMGAMSGAISARAVEAPDTWLERIAELRKQGKHEEADKALEEFRKRYPDYRLSEEMRVRVEKKN